MMKKTTVAHTRHGASHRLAGTVTFPDLSRLISVLIQDAQYSMEALAATVVIHQKIPVLFFVFVVVFSFSFCYLKQKGDTFCDLQYICLGFRTHTFHISVWDVHIWVCAYILCTF